MKQCIICKQTKPLTDFHKDKQVKDGHDPRCKKCKIAYLNKIKESKLNDPFKAF